MRVNSTYEYFWFGVTKFSLKVFIYYAYSFYNFIFCYLFSNFSINRSKPSRYLPDNINNTDVLFEKYINKIIRPSKREIDKNNPSRSAKLRFATRSDDPFVYPANLIKKFKIYLDLEATNV